MTRGASPWSDPAVETGFAAAYATYPPAQERRPLGVEDDAPEEDAALVDELRAGEAERELPPVPTPQDELDEAADAAARPFTRTGRRARAPHPGRLSPARAVAGAAVSVSGVLLGIGTLLWISDDPSTGVGPVVQEPPAAASAEGGSDPADASPAQPEAEQVPVEPVAPAPAPTAAPAAPPAAAPSVVVPVTVLNNSRTTGLADRAAARFRAGGWPVADTGNFRGRIRATTVYYEAGQQDSARAFARRFAGIERVLPRFEGLPGSGLTVVLTRDFE